MSQDVVLVGGPAAGSRVEADGDEFVVRVDGPAETREVAQFQGIPCASFTLIPRVEVVYRRTGEVTVDGTAIFRPESERELVATGRSSAGWRG